MPKQPAEIQTKHQNEDDLSYSKSGIVFGDRQADLSI